MNHIERPPIGAEVPPETPEERPPQPKEIPEEETVEEEPSLVEKDFENVFKIKPEELDSISGFDELSAGQQSLVLKNFKELTLKAIKGGAIEEVKVETAEAGFWGKVRHGAFRKYYSAKAEKLNADKILNAGIDLHREALTELVRQTKESGLNAEFDEKEKRLKILYAGRFENLDPKEQEIVAKFNQAADKFTKVSSEWRYSKREKAKFAKLEDEYKKALGEFGEVVKKIESSKTDNERLAELNTFKYIADIDKKLRLNQFLSSNPGACQELERIKSQSVWKKALWNTFLEKGGYMFMGGVARSLTVHFVALGAAPLAAAGIGGWIARKRAIESLREEAKLAESGKLSKVREAEVAAKIEKLEKKKAKEKDPRKIEKYEKKIEAIKKEKPELITSVKAENLEKKIDTLLHKLETTDPIADRIEIINELDTRLNYTRYKLESGLIQYGEGAEKIKHQYSLLQKLSEAEVMTRFYGGGKEGKIKIGSDAAEKVEKRLEEWLQFKERKVQKHVKGQVIRGAMMGAGFAVLGYGLRDLYERLGIDLGIERTIKEGATWIYERGDSALEYLSKLVAKDTVPSESLETLAAPLKELFSQHPEFKGDSTWKVGASGLITRKGDSGWYLLDKEGNLWWSGGKLPSGEESGPHVLRAGATEWAKTEELAVPATKEMMEEAAQEMKITPEAKPTAEVGERVIEVEPKTVKPPAYMLESEMVERQAPITGEELQAAKEMMEQAAPEVRVSPEQLELATIKQDEGVTHAIVRQLKVDPEKFGYDPKSGISVDRWAVLKSRDIAIENGYIRPDGSEVRVLHLGEGKNPAYLLDQDAGGRFHVREFLEGKPSGGGKPSPYEYEWKPLKVPAEEIEEVPVTGPQDLIKEVEIIKGGDSQLVYETTSVYKGVLNELANEDYLEDISALEHEKLINVAKHSAAQLDQWGVKPATGGSFTAQLEAALKASKISELMNENLVIYNNLATKISSALNVEWTKAGHMRMADIVRWSQEEQSNFTPGAQKLFETITKLKPTQYERTLSLDEFIKNRIKSGASDFKFEFVAPAVEKVSSDLNSFVQGLAKENLGELKENIPDYATVLGIKPSQIEQALTELSQNKNIVGNLDKFVAEQPNQARLLSKILEAEPELKPEAQALKTALDALLSKKG